MESHNNNDDVRVATPFGHMQVNTDRDQVQQSVGLSVYPGATVDDTEHGKNKSANIDMSFGSFRLRVKAISYHTPDPVATVESFYRKDLARYGTVIACAGTRPVGTPTRTPEGLTCDEDKEDRAKMHGNLAESSLTLKTGSRQHQRIVGLSQDGSTTRIGLVLLDLPNHLDAGDDEKEDASRQ